METNEIITKVNPMKELDGFEYTEDFDGKCAHGSNTIYFNLKFCCDAGGAQTRTLRLVYEFIKCQIKYINKQNDKQNENKDNNDNDENQDKHKDEKCNNGIYFINILDGDTSNTHIGKFRYLLDKLNNKKLEKYIFIGSMYEFSKEQQLINLLCG